MNQIENMAFIGKELERQVPGSLYHSVSFRQTYRPGHQHVNQKVRGDSQQAYSSVFFPYEIVLVVHAVTLSHEE